MNAPFESRPGAGQRLKRAGLVGVAVIVFGLPMLAAIDYWLGHAAFIRSVQDLSPTLAASLGESAVKRTALLVALVTVPATAGIALLRKPDASGAWALGVLAMAFGAIWIVFVGAELVVSRPTAMLAWATGLVALGIVPAAIGILLLRKRELSGVQALGLSVIALGVIVLAENATRIPAYSTLGVPSWGTAIARISWAFAASIVPLAVGILLLRKKRLTTTQSLALVTFALGVIGSSYIAAGLIALPIPLD